MGKKYGALSGYDWPHGPASEKGFIKGLRVRRLADNREGMIFTTDVGQYKNIVGVEFDDKTAGSHFMTALELIG